MVKIKLASISTPILNAVQRRGAKIYPVLIAIVYKFKIHRNTVALSQAMHDFINVNLLKIFKIL